MVSEVDPETVKEQLETDNFDVKEMNEIQIIDIRSQTQFEQGHLPEAINIPLDKLPRRIEEVDWKQNIVVACPIGQSSVQAARLIQSYENIPDSATVQSMAGGYDAWEYELVQDNQSQFESVSTESDE
ncbi:rhodanese-like domain-containing protein [Haloquadratum walsbyi]|jgi:Rhodanese-related sulfurtransferase|uniref:Rhodanese-related sulfurtransferase n=1 Tax=Haloquadratum walsbyi J07HQW2 TaxID=1238425 RepID=U1NEK7_9EURY|nr:rhodanese-like domain-containing protein [Haloquadratum walsbyi]ERG95445.1 MAG: rhodanese-related sulfurtransferase [Haloquadratum walsbyi J07HQW2]